MTSAPLQRYDPQHPDAGPDGYVAYPDINPLTEMVDLMGATRSYGMNASAVQAEKNMVTFFAGDFEVSDALRRLWQNEIERNCDGNGVGG